MQYGLQNGGSVQYVLQYTSSWLYVEKNISLSPINSWLVRTFLLHIEESGEIIVILVWHCPLAGGVKFNLFNTSTIPLNLQYVLLYQSYSQFISNLLRNITVDGPSTSLSGLVCLFLKNSTRTELWFIFESLRWNKLNGRPNDSSSKMSHF